VPFNNIEGLLKIFMALSSNSLNGGICIMLLLISTALLIFNLEYHVTSAESIINDGPFQSQIINQAKSIDRKFTPEIMTPDEYFDMYPSEILKALEGSYSTSYNLNGSNQQGSLEGERHHTEVILNADTAQAYLPGIAFINDQSMKFTPGNDGVFGKTQLYPEQSMSLITAITNQQSDLKLKSLPKGLSVVSSSDPRVTVATQISPDYKTSKYILTARIITCSHTYNNLSMS
jgi:hypothetical protein